MKKIMFFMMIATLLVCNIAKSQNTTGNNVLLTYTLVGDWNNLSASLQKTFLEEVNKDTLNAHVTLVGDSTIQVVLIKNIPFSKTTSKTGILIQMMDKGKLVNRGFSGDNPPTITRRTDGKLNAEGKNGDEDEYED